MKKLRVTLFDDNELLRESLAEVISHFEEHEFAGAFPNCLHLADDIIATHPDVVLMDISMPEMNGIEAVKLLRSHFPDMPVLMQTVFEDDTSVFDAIAAGAGGYILKNAPSHKLLEAITEVYQGGAPMSPPIARKVVQHFQHVQHEKESFRLTTREMEVLQYLVQGLPYKQIGDKMNIGYDTVRAHMKKVYEKLHVCSMTEAVAKAIKFNLFKR